jgi:hypothetical protein
MSTGWGWKLAEDPDDVVNFLGGCGPYGHPVKAAQVTAMWNGASRDFHVFYQPGTADQPLGNWGWKLAPDADDVMNFLSGTGPYCQPVKEAHVAALWRDGGPEFYVFYTMDLVPARIVDCQVQPAAGGAPGWSRLHLKWRYCDPGERPVKLLVSVFHEEWHWKNIMPDGQSCAIVTPDRVSEADVMVLRLYKGPHKIVFHAYYADHEELEYAFERLL